MRDADRIIAATNKRGKPTSQAPLAAFVLIEDQARDNNEMQRPNAGPARYAGIAFVNGERRAVPIAFAADFGRCLGTSVRCRRTRRAFGSWRRVWFCLPMRALKGTHRKAATVRGGHVASRRPHHHVFALRMWIVGRATYGLAAALRATPSQSNSVLEPRPDNPPIASAGR